jgi:hypothetical protein
VGRTDYRERPAPAGLGLACVWSQSVPVDDPEPYVQRVVPDACIDLIWSDWAGEVHVAGPDTGPFLPGVPPGGRLVGGRLDGGRLRPGLAADGSVRAAALRLGLSERQLRRRSLAAFAYWPKTLQRILRFPASAGLGSRRHLGGRCRLRHRVRRSAHLAHEVRELAGVPLTELPGQAVTAPAAPRR